MANAAPEGADWTWTAIDADTKLGMSWLVGAHAHVPLQTPEMASQRRWGPTPTRLRCTSSSISHCA
ncbi:MAG: hypothetical protein EOQ27_31720 [Mesorhizobium sp.]|nr:MAG: hypothetical protein EOQ27_31720 [Mesorhizobium sp.]